MKTIGWQPRRCHSRRTSRASRPYSLTWRCLSRRCTGRAFDIRVRGSISIVPIPRFQTQVWTSLLLFGMFRGTDLNSRATKLKVPCDTTDRKVSRTMYKALERFPTSDSRKRFPARELQGAAGAIPPFSEGWVGGTKIFTHACKQNCIETCTSQKLSNMLNERSDNWKTTCRGKIFM